MSSKKQFINIIRWSTIIDSFANNYFLRSIVLFLLANNVTPWIAVSIPIVLEFARMISRGFKFIFKIALNIDYKKFHIFYLFTFLIMCFLLTKCESVYTIYPLVIIMGFISGTNESCKTAINTSNEEYESYCFIEEERANVIGVTLGLIVGQFIYDFNKTAYILGYFVILIIGIVISLFIKNIKISDYSKFEINTEKNLSSKEKRQTFLVGSLFGIFGGLWCMSWGALDELGPLISNKIGYLNAVYSSIEIIILFIISGNLIKKIKSKKKLLLTITIVAIIDVFSFLIASITLSWKGLLIAYIITAFTCSIGNPLWGSLISEYSAGNRKKYIVVNRVYFIIKGIFTILTWAICRECVINGIETFKYLGIVLAVLIIAVNLLANKVNKKVFDSSI